MTPEKRFEQIEDVLSRWIEQSRKDYEENRRLWRESRDQIEATAREMRAGFAEVAAAQRETARQIKETHTHLETLGEATDKRIEDLVLAIGDLIRNLPREATRGAN